MTPKCKDQNGIFAYFILKAPIIFEAFNLIYVCGAPFVILGWTASCCTEAQVFWIRELGLVQLQNTLVRLVHKLCPVCRNFGHMPMAGETITDEL